MNGYTKEYVSDLLFNKIDAILIVDAKNDSYRTIKKEGLFENFLESEGSYKNLVEKLGNSANIEVKLSSKVEEIVGDDFGVTGVKVNGEILEVAGVFPYVGKKSISMVLNNLKPEKQGIFIKVDEECRTNIEGLFAAGDIVAKKLKQLVTAAGDGATAATSADNYCKLK